MLKLLKHPFKTCQLSVYQLIPLNLQPQISFIHPNNPYVINYISTMTLHHPSRYYFTVSVDKVKKNPTLNPANIPRSDIFMKLVHQLREIVDDSSIPPLMDSIISLPL